MGISDWSDMFPSTVLIADVSGTDEYNTPTYGADTSYPARIVYVNKMVTTPTGDEVLARGQVWVQRNTDVPVTSRITLPISAQPSSTPKILTTELFDDESGLHHVKVYFR